MKMSLNLCQTWKHKAPWHQNPAFLLWLPPTLVTFQRGPRVKSVTFKKCNIRDRNQQVLVLEGGVLKAVPDKDVTARETFYISVSHRRVVKPMNEGKNHIFLAVSKGELCLYCDKVKRPKHPSLQLKKKHIKELSSLKAKDCLPFTFIREQEEDYRWILYPLSHRGIVKEESMTASVSILAPTSNSAPIRKRQLCCPNQSHRCPSPSFPMATSPIKAYLEPSLSACPESLPKAIDSG
ncbi:PREDICTED: interleukin-37-like isoform X2 [Capra hircus]|uniref:interleukin-37-like isoform X2 n=1 Tax=Capra hircus TaxID=9925 RepID=UPI000846DE59|nr:PREDICTED: interleukin-37-like isoform X2 [Capra hircus]